MDSIIIKKYIYNDTEYRSEYQLRKEIWNKERKAFGKPEKVEEWAELGVTYIEETYTPPEPTIEELRSQKKLQLKERFEQISETTYLKSSLGFWIDANDTANRNVQSLIRQLEYAIENGAPEDTTVQFRDYNNQYQNVTLANIKVLQNEIDANGTYLYGIKWQYEAQIDQCESKDDLDLITFMFPTKDFTPVVEPDESTDESTDTDESEDNTDNTEESDQNPVDSTTEEDDTSNPEDTI